MVSIPPGSALGQYRVIEQLGRGGMATVFRCHDPNLDRYVAVKVLPSYYTEDPTFVARFTQEAQTVARLNHPNILQIYDFGEDKGFTYIVSELVLGGDLQDKLGNEPLPTEEALGFMRPLAEALDHAHSQGIIHRDLKPANVLIDTEGRPILADFGLARMLENTARFTQASQALGTPEYMSPEQAMGADGDHRSDLYAFGIMVYQMLVGQTPFRADTPAATLMAHVHRALPLPTQLNPNIGPRLEAALLKALAKDPNDRFQSAEDMIRSLSIATGLGREAAAADMGATAVRDTADIGSTDVTDAPTAVIGAADDSTGVGHTALTPRPGGVAPRGPEAPTSPPDAVPSPTRKRLKLLVGGGIGAAAPIVVVVAVVLFSGGGEADDTEENKPTAVPEATTASTMTLAEAVATLEGVTTRAEQNLIKGRDITPTEEIKPSFRTREQLAEITREFFRRESLREQVFEAQELYKVLGLMEDEQDLEEILTEIQLQHVYALFDDESEAVYVLSDTLSIGPVEELAYAGAYFGGVQQNLFNTAQLRDVARRGSADEFRAVSALISGDVASVLAAYIGTVFSREELDELDKPLADNKLLAAPHIIRETVLFPQREGADFVAELYGTNSLGWDGVNDAYSDTPVSTEQVLHPEKYFAREEPLVTSLPNLAESIGKGWVEVSENTMVEFLIRAYMGQHLGATQAVGSTRLQARAATGTLSSPAPKANA